VEDDRKANLMSMERRVQTSKKVGVQMKIERHEIEREL
jgi:hypothetical protein